MSEITDRELLELAAKAKDQMIGSNPPTAAPSSSL